MAIHVHPLSNQYTCLRVRLYNSTTAVFHKRAREASAPVFTLPDVIVQNRHSVTFRFLVGPSTNRGVESPQNAI